MIAWQARQLVQAAELARRGVNDNAIRSAVRMRWDTFKRVRPRLEDGIPGADVLLRRLAAANRDMNSHRAGAARILDDLVLGMMADDLDAMTLVILSDLKVQVQESGGAIRVYATARSSGKPLANAYVTVSDGRRILGRGRTDARGVFEVRGSGGAGLSIVAEHEGAYALFRRGLLE